MATGQPLQADRPMSGAYMVSAADGETSTHQSGNTFMIPMSLEELTSFTTTSLHAHEGLLQSSVPQSSVQEGEGSGEVSSQVLDDFAVLSHHGEQWVSEAVGDQGMRDRALFALANPDGSSSLALISHDFSRTQGINPQDARALGAPCFGNHIPSEPGRGSNTGSNKHATWIGCIELRRQDGVYSSIRCTRPVPSSRPIGGRRREAVEGEEAGEGIDRAQQQEDWFGRGGEVHGRSPESNPPTEEGADGQEVGEAKDSRAESSREDRGLQVHFEDYEPANDNRPQRRNGMDSRSQVSSNSGGTRRGAGVQQSSHSGERRRGQLGEGVSLRDSRSPSSRRSYVGTTSPDHGESLHGTVRHRDSRSRSRGLNSSISLPMSSASSDRHYFPDDENIEDYEYD